MGLRIKGQETSITFTGPGGLVTSLDNIQSFEIELKMDVLSEGYLGQSTEQKDDIFKGCGFRMSAHTRTGAVLDFLQAIKDRSQRRTADAGSQRFVVNTRFVFPDGSVRRAMLPDLFFSSPGINIGGRDEYVEFPLEGEAEDVVFF